MRWSLFAVTWLWLVCSGFAQDGEPKLEILTRTSVLDVGVKRALYCKTQNMDDSVPIVWVSPKDEEVQPKRGGADGSRVYTELKMMPENSRILVLYFFPPMYEDSGVWTCKAGTYNQSLEIVVGHKIKLDTPQSDINIDEGKTAKIKCEGFGSPEPVVHWYKDNVPIPDDPNKYVLSKKGNITFSLEIKKVDFQDTGAYMCKVTQKALSHYTNNTIKLFVHHKPIPFVEDSEAEADISKGNNLVKYNEVYAIMGEEKNITCRVIAYPLPTFEWYRTNKKTKYSVLIRDEDRIFTSEDRLSSSLLLTMRSEDDVTEYKCTVHNPKGTLSIVFDVNIAERPPVPTSIGFADANATCIVFNVTCENCTLRNASDVDQEVDPANLPVIGYAFELAPHSEEYSLPEWDRAISTNIPIDDPENTLFEVCELENLTKYHVRVATMNKGGNSIWLELDEPASTTAKAIRIIATVSIMFIVSFVMIYC